MSDPEMLDAPHYILDAFEPSDRIALLVLNRDLRETVQRITTAAKAATPDFQAWLRHKNSNGADIYMGMNPLKPDAATRTKDEIDSIRHVYLDLDYGGEKGLTAIRDSSAVPRPNVVLASSPGKYQVVWKVEGMDIEEAEALLHALSREFGGDPAATDATRVLRVPGFANKKYESDSYVEARKYSNETHHLRDFKLHIDGQDSPRPNYHPRQKREGAKTAVSQSERDWAFAKRALSRGDNPEAVIQEIARYRANDKSDPEYYARLTVTKALAELGNTETRSVASSLDDDRS
jgi:RepB DNA-primase from phage plasmid